MVDFVAPHAYLATEYRPRCVDRAHGLFAGELDVHREEIQPGHRPLRAPGFDDVIDVAGEHLEPAADADDRSAGGGAADEVRVRVAVFHAAIVPAALGW